MTVMFSLLKNRDVIIASLVVGIVLIIIIPLTPGVMDFLLIVNLSLSLVIFLTTLFTTNTLQLSVFPTLLLVTTLLRLALNVRSTTLILGQGGAGQVIAAFGGFVIGGNYVVGFVVFIIVTVIQFVVITNGAGRVAEVAARFTLDAMPGKQMAVDADLNTGLITEAQARERRRTLQREADFFGAMDGASKFVKGDAIAGIVITLVNILAGLVVGMVQLGMPAMVAVQRYVLLTVGDGLVSQLPALLISTATGILVTRSGSDSSFGQDFVGQLFSLPKALGLTAVVLFGLGLVPALPFIPFAAMAGAAGYATYTLVTEDREVVAEEDTPAVALPLEPEDVLSLISSEQLEIEIGFGLVRLADGSLGGDLMERLTAVRRRLILEYGLYIRPIRIRDNLQLKPNEYVFKVRGHQVARSELMTAYYLAMDYTGSGVDLPGVETTEPTFNLPAKWISENDREQAELLGYTVVDPTTVLVTHLTETIKRHGHELLGRQEVKEIIDKLKEQHPAVIEELSGESITVGDIQKVLQGLLAEGIPIKDLAVIFEAIADNIRLSREADFLLERVRQSLSRAISRIFADDYVIHAVTLHPKADQTLVESLASSGGSHLILEPSRLHTFFDNLARQAETAIARGKQPVILCSSRLRLPLRRLTQRHFPNVYFISPGEVASEYQIETLGTVSIE